MKFKDLKKMVLEIIDGITRTYKDNLPAWTISAIMFILGALGNVGYSMLIMVVLSGVDMLLGIGSSLKNGIGIQSRRLRDTPIKVFVYVLVVLCMFMFDCLIDNLTGITTKYLALISCCVFAAVEIWSIIGNITRGFPSVGAIPLIKRMFASEVNKKLSVSVDDLSKATKSNYVPNGETTDESLATDNSKQQQ